MPSRPLLGAMGSAATRTISPHLVQKKHSTLMVQGSGLDIRVEGFRLEGFRGLVRSLWRLLDNTFQ